MLNKCLCASHHSQERPANRNCTYQNFRNIAFVLQREKTNGYVAGVQQLSIDMEWEDGCIAERLPTLPDRL